MSAYLERVVSISSWSGDTRRQCNCQKQFHVSLQNPFLVLYYWFILAAHKHTGYFAFSKDEQTLHNYFASLTSHACSLQFGDDKHKGLGWTFLTMLRQITIHYYYLSCSMNYLNYLVLYNIFIKHYRTWMWHSSWVLSKRSFILSHLLEMASNWRYFH